ncbi:unnamed protein product [Tenebrio molitor]|nr:unnamed protein product [Tenebrio molitor]
MIEFLTYLVKSNNTNYVPSTIRAETHEATLMILLVHRRAAPRL